LEYAEDENKILVLKNVLALQEQEKLNANMLYKRHILTKKAKDRKRALTQDGLVCKADTPNVKFMLAI